MSAALPSATPALVPAGPILAGVMIGLTTAAVLLAGWLPIAFSIATVFLFAGPHNWAEARYILGRLPARAGKLMPFFGLSAFGILGLTLGFIALPSVAPMLAPGMRGFTTAVAIWNSALLLWLATLVQMRSEQNPRREWGWVWPLTFFLLAVVWTIPYTFSIALVYVHPLMSLWLLDRELARSRPNWRPTYHRLLLLLPIYLGVLILRLHDSPDLDDADPLAFAITNHAGGGIISGVSTHLLVALHTFLEMVHYSVWLLILPYLGWRSLPWNLETIPAARRNDSWRRGVALFLLAGLFVVLVLWVCFMIDYSTTRRIYFLVAMIHVLAEFPFLLRSL